MNEVVDVGVALLVLRCWWWLPDQVSSVSRVSFSVAVAVSCVVLFCSDGWTTNPKTKEFSWIAKNAWGTSRLPKFLQENDDVDRQGRTLYHDNADGITPNTFPGGTMVAFSYTSVVPDVEHYMKKVQLKTKLVSTPVVSLSLFAEFDDPEERKKVKALLPDCERLSSSTKPPATAMRRLKSMFGGHGGHDDDHSNEQVDEEFQVTRCEAEITVVHAVTVTATVPRIDYNDGEGGLSLRLRIRKEGKGTFVKDWKSVTVDPATSKDNTVAVQTKLFFPSLNPRTKFPHVQRLQAPLDYVTLELLGWSYNSYNKEPSWLTTKAKASDVRANGEGASGQGAILRTIDVFLGPQYTDVVHACDPAASMDHYCGGGRDRQCVRALGRHLDRFTSEVWTQAEEGGGGNKKNWRKEQVTIETLHSGEGGRQGSCLQFSTLEKCLPMCGKPVARKKSEVDVKDGFMSRTKVRKCAGFSFEEGGEEICLNDVVADVLPTKENEQQRDRVQRMVCLAVRWASLKYSNVECAWPSVVHVHRRN